MKQTNYIVNEAFFRTGTTRYQYAHHLGISEQTLYRKLRVELPIDEQMKMASEIERYANEVRKDERVL